MNMQTIQKQLFRQGEAQAEAEGKSAYWRLHTHRYTAILQSLNAQKGAHILEAGVTPGQFTRLLVGLGYRVSGIDLDPTPRRALWEDLGVEVCRMNMERESIPFTDETFDRVVFSEVIEHLVFSPLPILREFHRVLVPGGRLIITTPNELYLKSRLRSIFRLLLWQSLDTTQEFRHQIMLEGEARYTTHSRTYTMNELCWVAEQAGFRVVERRYVAAWERVGIEKKRMVRNPAGVLAKSFLTTLTMLLPSTRSMLVVVGEKE